jgi:methionyl-tRNA synthetase
VAAEASDLGKKWAETWPRIERAMERFLLGDALAALGEFIAAANRFVDAEQPWQLAKTAKAGDGDAQARLTGVLGDLLEACRVVSLAYGPFMPSASRRVSGQLGLDYGYDERGARGQPLGEAVAWGSAASGKVGTAEILFPRVDLTSE